MLIFWFHALVTGSAGFHDSVQGIPCAHQLILQTCNILQHRIRMLYGLSERLSGNYRNDFFANLCVIHNARKVNEIKCSCRTRCCCRYSDGHTLVESLPLDGIGG